MRSSSVVLEGLCWWGNIVCGCVCACKYCSIEKNAFVILKVCWPPLILLVFSFPEPYSSSHLWAFVWRCTIKLAWVPSALDPTCLMASWLKSLLSSDAMLPAGARPGSGVSAMLWGQGAGSLLSKVGRGGSCFANRWMWIGVSLALCSYGAQRSAAVLRLPAAQAELWRLCDVFAVCSG